MASTIQINRYLVETKQNTQKQGLLPVMDRIYSRSKGDSDLFAIVARSAKLAGYIVSESYLPWTTNVQNIFSKARNVLGVPYLVTCLNKTQEKPDFRNGLETSFIAIHCSSLFVLKDAVSTALGNTAATMKIVVDSIDLKRSVHKYIQLNQLASVAKTSSKEIRNAIQNGLAETAYRVGKYALSILSGLSVAVAWLASITLPPTLAVAAICAGLGSVIFSFMADYSSETIPLSLNIVRIV